VTETWRVSALTSALRCGEAYRRRYLEKEGRPPTTALIRGSAVHRAIGVGMLLQKDSGAVQPPDLMEDVAATEVDRARHGGATLTADEASAGLASTWGELKDAAATYAGGYARQVAPAVRPVAVEQRLTVTGLIPGIDLQGTIDLVTDENDGGYQKIRDAKTSGRTPAQNAADVSSQLTMYSLLQSVKAEKPVTRVGLDVLVRHKGTGVVTAVHRASTRGPADFKALLARIQVVASAVRAGIFLPADPATDWFCSETWCEYWHTCPFSFGPSRRG